MGKAKEEKVEKYEVVGPNLTDPKTGKPYAVGTVIELTEKQAKNRAGVVIPAGSKKAVGNPALDAANEQVTTLTADLEAANGEKEALQGLLDESETANADLTADLEAANKKVVELTPKA